MKKGKYFIIGRIGNLIINAKHDQPLVDIRLASASRVENVIGVMNKLMAENTDLDEQ